MQDKAQNPGRKRILRATIIKEKQSKYHIEAEIQ